MSQFEILLALLFGAGAIAGLAANTLRDEHRRWSPLLAALFPLAGFFWIASLPTGIIESRPWAPSLGIELAWRLDGLSQVFALMILGIGSLILFYTAGVMGSDPKLGRLVSGLMAFMASMLGLVLSDSLLLTFVFWELTSITSFLLIGFYGEEEKSRKSALQALIITGGGGLALLLGLLWLSNETGASRFSDLPIAWQGSASTLPILILLAAGVWTKSAQFPFHSWLPKAMAAPTPVSAYLHSATMVKAGVYLAARLQPTLSEIPLWRDLITWPAAVTLIVAAWMAWGARDFKRLLAATTLGSLALLCILAVQGGSKAALAFALFLVGHAIYKAALFMTAGLLEKESGSRDPAEVKGLGGRIPWVWAGAGLAGLSMVGLIPLFGFVGKEYTITALLGQPLLLALVILAASSWVFAALQVAVRPFVGKPDEDKKDTKKSGYDGITKLAKTLPIVVLGVASLVLGLMLEPFADAYLKPLAQSLAVGQEIKTPHLWGGFNLELGLSTLAIILGSTAYYAWGIKTPAVLEQKDYFTQGVGLFNQAAQKLSDLLDHRRLRWDFMEFLLVPCLLGIYLLLNRSQGFGDFTFMPIQWHEIIVLAAGLIGAALTMFSWSRLNSMALLGALGLATTSIYIFMGAPDLALTQILVDLLTVVFMVLVLGRLPRFRRISGRKDRWRDAAIATVIGGFFGLITLYSHTYPNPPAVSDFHLANSVSGAKGHNVVNTIIVDFRAMDTLGEITVLALAAWGIKELMRLRKVAK
jgi:multicomponent Na+:H+ antiporter subunit A